MKYYKGYITSRDCFGTYFPQRIQNIVIRDFCSKNNFGYELSAAEYTMENSYLVLNEMINDMKRLDGIIAFSMFQLPIKKKERVDILKRILKKRKKIFFVLERLEVEKNKDIISLNEIWNIKFSTLNSKIPRNLK
jgi:sporadic carbohydrate cluster protein (TIGR04323 family)